MKLPAKRNKDIMCTVLKLRGPSLPFLPLIPLRWIKVSDNSFVAESKNTNYIVHRRPKSNNIYWLASVLQVDGKHTILGEEYLSKFEAIEVCEAWEYQREQENERSKPKELPTS